MPRFLVDLYPCRRCGKKVPARSQREAERARCERCTEYERIGGLANMRVEDAGKLAKAGTLEDSLEAVSKYAQAARDAIQAGRLSPKRGEAQRWAAAAEDWGRRAFDVLARLRSPLIQYARHERFVRAVDGGGEAEAEAVDAEVRAPLRLLVPGEPVIERTALELAAERWAAIRPSLNFRREVHPPTHWDEEAKRERRWIFIFAPSERKRKPWDVYLIEGWIWCQANLTAHKVAPAHATGVEARAWAVTFAQEVGFPPLEATSPGKVVRLRQPPATGV